MTLIRGADIKIQLYLSGAWTEITCDTTSAEWTWGAPEALGPLTECEGGTLRVSMYDPTRKYDPDNPSSPLLGVLKVGLGFRVLVDNTAAWTGVLQTWGWDRASKIADLNGVDPIGMLSMRAIPAAQTLQSVPDLATSAQQAQYLLDIVEWPSAKRYFPDGTSGVPRGNHTIEGSALDGLGQIRFAELGRLFPMRDGRIGWTDRDGPTPPASSATINCGGGVDLTDMWKAMGLGRVRNRVVVSAGYGVYGAIRPPDEYRSVTTTPFFLSLGYQANPAPLNEDLWAQTILDALNPPPILTMLGTMLPEGAEVKTITTAEFGARWTVKVTGEPDVVVQLIGQRVAVAPGSIEVDVVTEDVVTKPSVVHSMMGTGSGYLRSTSSVNYTFARDGTGGSVIPTINTPDTYVGQYLIAGPEWSVAEGFFSFDTSSIPAGATITKAVFAAMILPQYSVASGDTWLDFAIEVRSYPTGGWRPTLAAADWIVGAGSTTLRASFNTALAAATGHGGFYEWADAGSGLAGAVKKAGITELYVVSARTVAGTAPVSSSSKEEVTLGFVRLRVTYTP